VTATTRSLLLAVQRGRVRRYGHGFEKDCYPRIDVDVTPEAEAAEAEGLLWVGNDDSGGWRAVHLTDAGRAWLEAHPEKETNR